MVNNVFLRNIQQLSKNLNKNLSYKDINYTGIKEDRNHKKYITIDQGSPILNEYKMWLRSGFYDYIRRPNFGGFFAYNLNNYPFDPSSEPIIKQDLIDKTHALFPTIEIINCEVTCLPVQRKWKVKVVVGDTATGLVAADMAANGESIVFNVDNVQVD